MTVDVYGSWLPVEQPGAVTGFADELLGHGHLMDTSEEQAPSSRREQRSYQSGAMFSTYL